MAGVTFEDVTAKLASLASPRNAEGMAGYGIRPRTRVLGISIYDLHKIAREIGRDHRLAQRLWRSKIHEARILASYIEEPEKVTPRQLDAWVRGFDSWDIVDQVSELIARTPFAREKIHEWAGRDEEFVRRAAFALIAEIAWHHKTTPDKDFEQFFPVIKKAATDDRNFVKKAVNWALRNIGKRSPALNRRATRVAREIQAIDSKSARWIAADALRELTSPSIQRRLRRGRPRR